VTQKLVADHGGTVDFSSRPGEGTTFRVLLPVAAEPEKKELPIANCKMPIAN
jgi:nitrogen-specific signal transduction histidine kinase